MFFKPASFVLLLAASLQGATGTPAVSTLSPNAGLARRDTQITQVQTFTEKWTSVTTAFKTCHGTVISTQSSMEMTYTSITTLSQTCKGVAQSYPSCNECATADPSSVTTFRSNIEAAFKLWANIISVSQQRYGQTDEWNSKFVSLFAEFKVWITAVDSACTSLQLQLDVIIQGLNLDLDIFLNVNINLGDLLGISLGGIIGVHAKRLD